MERINANEVQSMMEAYASVYKTEEQEVISEETQELQENQANRAKQQRLRQQQLANRPEPKPGPVQTFRDRIFARRSSSPAARANTNKVGQNIKVGSPTGPAQNEKLKKPTSTPTVLADKKPAQSPTSNLKPGSPNTVVSPKSGEETKFERRLPSMAELKAAQAARKAAAAGGASKQEAEYQAVKAGVNAGKPAPKPAAKPAAAGPGGYKVSAAATPKLGGSIPLSQKAKMQDLSKKDTGSFFDGAKGGKYDTSAKPAAAAPTPPPAVKKKPAPGARNRMRMEEVDIFDTIKEYLIGEGATEEEALKQMLTLTDEQRTEILEAEVFRNRKPFSDAGEYPMRDAMRDAGMNRAPNAPVVPVKKAKKKPTTQMASYEPEGELVDEGSCGSKKKPSKKKRY